MSYENFDYDKALSSIKATLFDIYEAQERLVGSIDDDEKRQIQINKYIKMKDTAINLIENIENLVNDKLIDKVDNIKKDTTQNGNNINAEPELVEIDLANGKNEFNETKNKVVGDNVTPDNDLDIKTIDEKVNDDTLKEEAIENEAPNLEDVDINDSNDLSIEEKKKLEKEDNQEEKISNDVENKDNKFYLDNRNGTKPNFAFVPQTLYDVLKKNGILELNLNSIEQDENVSDDRFHKSDDNKPRGIIVRNDQFMKLALSKRRQEGVLADAKVFRIEQAKASRKKMLEEEEKKINIKTKNLKLSA